MAVIISTPTNYLQLVNRLKQECDVTGADLTTVEGQTGEYLRLVNWIEEAWADIQLKNDNWRFRRKSMTFQTVASTASYSTATIGLTDFAMWKDRSFRIFLTSVGQTGETFLTQKSYDIFRDTYLYGSLKTAESRPNIIAIKPDESLVLALVPDAIYTVSGDYYSVPYVMGSEADPSIATPDMPTRFYLAIVGLAMQKYAIFESAPEVKVRGEDMFKLYYNKLTSSQAPNFSHGSPMIG